MEPNRQKVRNFVPSSFKMKPQIISDDDGRSFIIASVHADVEYVDPIKYLRDRTINMQVAVYSKLLELHKKFPPDAIKKVATGKAEKFWDERLAEMMATEVPQGLLSLLDAPSKRDQVKLFRSISLTAEQLYKFIFIAFTDFGFTYSQYRSEIYPTGTNTKDMPKVAKLDRETGAIEKIGASKLSDGQIKQAIEQRKVVVTKFIDRGDEWHCFFITYRSIGGEESWRNGQPHYHYISDKFGIPRDEAVEKFRSNQYPTSSVHIPLLQYGNQPKGAR